MAKRNARKPKIKLGNAGLLTVSLAGGALALVGLTGNLIAAGAGALVMWKLVFPHVTAGRGVALTVGRPLRALGWVTVVAALAVAVSGVDAPGGPVLGVTLAASLATALHVTRHIAR